MSSAILTWTDPTTRVDGTPLTLGQINVLQSTDNGVTYALIGHAAPGQQTFTAPTPSPGTYLFELEAVDTQTPPVASADTAPVSLVVAPPPLAQPSQPTNVSVVAGP